MTTVSAQQRPMARVRHPVRALPVLGGAVLAGAVAALANELLGQLAIALFGVWPDFAPFHVGAPALSTMLACLGAAVVLLATCRLSSRPERTFHLVAVGVLVLSYAPIIALARRPDAIFGTSPAAIGALGMMHLVAYGVSVPWLLRRARLARIG